MILAPNCRIGRLEASWIATTSTFDVCYQPDKQKHSSRRIRCALTRYRRICRALNAGKFLHVQLSGYGITILPHPGRSVMHDAWSMVCNARSMVRGLPGMMTMSGGYGLGS